MIHSETWNLSQALRKAKRELITTAVIGFIIIGAIIYILWNKPQIAFFLGQLVQFITTLISVHHVNRVGQLKKAIHEQEFVQQNPIR